MRRTDSSETMNTIQNNDHITDLFNYSLSKINQSM